MDYIRPVLPSSLQGVAEGVLVALPAYMHILVDGGLKTGRFHRVMYPPPYVWGEG